MLGEERVDAKAVAALESRQEKVGALELGKPIGRVAPVENCVAQLRRELAEHGDAVQKGAVVFVERREDLGAQVVGDEALVTAERGHRSGWVVDGLQPDAGEDQRCGPAFRALDQQVDLLGAQLQLALSHKQRSRLGRGEGEVARPQLGELLGGTQPWKADIRVDPRADDHAHVLGHAAERVVDRRQAVPLGHGVEVVKHEDHGLPVTAKAAHQLVDDVLDGATCDAQPLKRRSA